MSNKFAKCHLFNRWQYTNVTAIRQFIQKKKEPYVYKDISKCQRKYKEGYETRPLSFKKIDGKGVFREKKKEISSRERKRIRRNKNWANSRLFYRLEKDFSVKPLDTTDESSTLSLFFSFNLTVSQAFEKHNILVFLFWSIFLHLLLPLSIVKIYSVNIYQDIGLIQFEDKIYLLICSVAIGSSLWPIRSNSNRTFPFRKTNHNKYEKVY